MKRGLIVNNIGTPASPTRSEVKAYLDEFLMDRNVIGAPWPIRFLLVRGFITPRRSGFSAQKYAKIWMPEGSPLLVHTDCFARKLQDHLGDDWVVKVGMRYGRPSIREALEDLKKAGVQELVFAPMYPQSAQSTTGSAIERLMENLEGMNWGLPLKIVKPFHENDDFLDSVAAMMKPKLKPNDHVVFSFHGLPESHLVKSKDCLKPGCCDRAEACDAGCYKAQSLKTAKDLAKKLNLNPEDWTASFQSRLGPTKWIGPSTEETLKKLAKQNMPVVIACPSFVTDCLETLEEIGLESSDEFKSQGGPAFELVPCLNSEDAWIETFKKIVEKALGPGA